ncbi:uncharacterized protein LOC142574138 [Dermacentor variabilis]|uniref:uncharacterized protein LOC142574138 n=1 Tax=Dermacentor variabilis TaxID=34621 RepID=UPI003F5B4CD2
MESNGDHEKRLLFFLSAHPRGASFTILPSPVVHTRIPPVTRITKPRECRTMRMPSCFAVMPVALLLLLVLQASPSAGLPAMRTLSVAQAESGEHPTPAGGGGGGRSGRGRYDYVYECAKCDDNASTDIGATVYAYDG